MDAGFSFLLLSSVAGAVVAAHARVNRLERIGLVLFHVVIACVGVASALASGLGAHGPDDGRALLASAAGPFLALLLRVDASDRRTERLVSAASAGLLVLGVVTQASLLLRWTRGGVEALVADVAVVLTAFALLRDAWRRRRGAMAATARSQAGAELVAAALLLGAALLTMLAPAPAVASGATTSWALALGAAAAWATASRAGRAPPDRRDLAVALLGTLFAVVVVPAAALPGAAAAVLTAAALGRAIWPARASSRRRIVDGAASAAPLDPRALGAMVPVLADAALRGAGRARVVARSPARRLLEAAIDRLQRSRPTGEGRVVVEVVATDPEADVEGDPGELAEALAAVLDSALRPGGTHPVVIVLRTSAQSVSIELTDGVDGAALLEAPAASDLGGGGGRGPDGSWALARARLLLERSGGALRARSGPAGPTVQVTLPRRPIRVPVGAA
ncbi:MAG: hypothetical protein FJ137_07530 [Deltaproteobacteria bacterium]|nr:hypothetical protein [Deltaproteobacteria bacterium]